MSKILATIGAVLVALATITVSAGPANADACDDAWNLVLHHTDPATALAIMNNMGDC